MRVMHYAVIDAFTSRPFAGNPAAVVLMPHAQALSAQARQRFAAEFNLSETAYVYPKDDWSYGISYFTPLEQVPLCGHATLAAAHLLFTADPSIEQLKFMTELEDKDLTCELTGQSIAMSFPSMPCDALEDAADVITALRLTSSPVATGLAGELMLVELENEQAVRQCSPDLQAIRTLAMGVIITAQADASDCDFVSRFFAPAVGIDEDPVTGLAHCVLTPWWCQKLKRNELRAHQASSRGGDLKVTLSDDGKKVQLAGQASTIMEGLLDGDALVAAERY